jgi:hypothetical protein
VSRKSCASGLISIKDAAAQHCFLPVMAACGLDPVRAPEARKDSEMATAAAAAPHGSTGASPTRPLPDYVEGPIRAFALITLFWGIVGFLVGVIIAAQLAWPLLNLDIEWTTFGRLRPLHTSAVIFAFGGNALLGTSLYIVQRTCRARLFGGEEMGWFLFWGYQFFIVSAALGYVLGVTQGKEYAEPEWFVDLFLTVLWVIYLVAFMGTIIKREEPHIYVANWFFLAFIITVAMLHIGNNISLPVSIGSTWSYAAPPGVQGTIMRIGLSGNRACASAGVASAPAKPAITARRPSSMSMLCSRFFSGRLNEAICQRRAFSGA